MKNRISVSLVEVEMLQSCNAFAFGPFVYFNEPVHSWAQHIQVSIYIYYLYIQQYFFAFYNFFKNFLFA